MKRLIIVICLVLMLIGSCSASKNVSSKECMPDQILAANRCWIMERVINENGMTCYSLEAVGYFNMVEFVCK